MKYYHFVYALVMLAIIIGFVFNNRQNDVITIVLAIAALLSTSTYTFHHNRSRNKK